MKTSLRPLLVAAAMAALLVSPVLRAVDAHSAQTRADQAKALPVTTTVTKGEPGPDYGGPYVLTVKNTSAAELKLKAVVVQSIVSHNRPKTIELPEHALAAGGSWAIKDLAVADKVTLNAAGHDPVVVVIEAAK